MMKSILTILLSFILVVSGSAQTRNVVVGTNGAVVQPTNFWSADVTNARSGLGLGSAATNPASAFQPSSSVLSNIASSNAINLTNVQASNIIGVIPATNIGSLTLSNIGGVLSLSKGGTGATNASGARVALELGSSATNPSSAFQQASSVLSNLSIFNADGLTNISSSSIIGTVALASNITGTAPLATNVTGIVSLINGGTGATNASEARTALGLGTSATNPASAFQPASSILTNLAANNGASLTNIIAANIVGIVGISTNVSGVVALVNGGTGATNASGARAALELGTASTNSSSAFQTSSSVLTNLASSNGGSLTNVTAANVVGTVALASNITGTAPLATNVTGVVNLQNGGTSGTNASSARTSLGATTIGANLFTLANPDDVRFIRLNANSSVSSLTAADMRTALSVGTNLGTVTSVGMSIPPIFSLSTPTITSSGTFAITLANQTSRQVFIAPNGGGIPFFRALDSDDLPSLAISKIAGLQTALDGKLSTTGTSALATNVTGVVGLANGGTSGTNAESARIGIGATTVGSAVFTLPNPSAVRFLRYNADNTVSALSDSDFRTAIGLSSAATNPVSFFQPSSSVLTNLANNNGSSLTNIVLGNVVGLQSALDGKLATNGNAANLTNFPTFNQNTTGTASNVTGVVAIANGGTGATNSVDARNNLGLGSAATNSSSVFQQASSILTNISAGNAVNLTNIQATNLVGLIPALNISNVNLTNISGTLAINSGGTGATNASVARSNLGLDSAATNPASAFQPSSLTLSNLANNNGTNLTNILVSGVVGALSTNGNAVALTNFPESLLRTNGNGGNLTNLTAANITGTVALASNVTGTIAISNGGSGATNAGGARTNYGLVWTGLTNTNASSFRSALELSASWLTNTNVTNFRTAIGLGATNMPLFNGVVVGDTANNPTTAFIANSQSDEVHYAPDGITFYSQTNASHNIDMANAAFNNANTWTFNSAIGFGTATNAATTRTNLGLGWTALTNTTASGFQTALFGTNTNPVLVSANGTVVSPTNFWQVAPIQTLVQDLTVIVTSQTNNATNARNLYVYSLATNVSGISNTILLPTNAATFAGDEVTVIHQGTTNTTTVVRQAGSTNNLITISRFDEAVKFIRESGQWDFYHNISYVEPIRFSGTNASNNIAATRTNLGLGETNNVTFSNVVASGTLTATSTVTAKTNLVVEGFVDFTTNRAATNGPTNAGNFNTHAVWITIKAGTNTYFLPAYK